MRFNEEEYAAFSSAAERQGLSNGAYAAQVCMAHVRGLDSAEQEAMRDLLRALMLTTGQVRKVGVLFNQVVARLNATGEQAERFVVYAAAADRTLRRVDELTARVRTHLSWSGR
ncbi:hypothetical protein [Actinocorallia populi]|uniref:hypothetical protein n=1 Tax=Actinocorallia populi TaxID=2079200 RepID=UPI001300B4B3|nr:hypothetical protein [Actinocorallia populi]